jgi:anti-sigma factor RsiW
MAACLNEEILQAYLDGELASDAAAAALTHLAGCAACAARLREVEQALSLLDCALADELPEYVPTASLRARVETALAAEPLSKHTFAEVSFARQLLDLLAALSPQRWGLLAATALVVIVLAGGLLSRFWQAPAPKPAQTVAQDSAPNVPAQTSAPKTQDQEAGNDRRNQPKLTRRHHQLVRQTKPRPIHESKAEQATVLAAVRQPKPSRPVTLRDLETNEHLKQTQLLLRAFRNTDVQAGEAATALSYERQLSRELLSKNRLLRRSAVNKEDVRAEELLNDIEPLLLDIANLPDQPSLSEVGSIKELIREQKIIATLQLYSARASH